MVLRYPDLDNFLNAALREDIGDGDITTNSCVAEDAMSRGIFIAKEPGVICGIEILERVFKLIDERVYLSPFVLDGAYAKEGFIFAKISGHTRSILTGERTALNMIQHLSGIATRTAQAVQEVSGTNVAIVDTRKTTPGLRVLEKYAVTCGGGKNHRFGLHDGFLVKDNHIKAAGGIKSAVDRVRKYQRYFGLTNIPIEVETETIRQVYEALSMEVDIIMLDNMSPELMAEAVQAIGGRAKTEASGNMGDKDLRQIAETGVDYISIGALTHSVKSLDISLKFE